MSSQVTVLSDQELDAVGAGSFINLSTNVAFSTIKQTNYSKVYGSAFVSVQQSNNVGTTVIVGT